MNLDERVQAVLHSWLMLVSYCVLLPGTWYAYRRFRRWLREDEEVWDTIIGSDVFGLMVFMVVGVVVIAAVVNIIPMLTGFINPEYWALQQVLEAVR